MWSDTRWPVFSGGFLSTSSGGKLGNLGNLGHLFFKIFISALLILAIRQNRKLGIIIPRFSKFARFSSFLFAIFSSFKKFFFHCSKVKNSVHYIYVMYCFQSLLKCFSLQQKYIMFKLLQCRNNRYLLWDVSILKGLSFLRDLLKSHHVIEK